jgi:hypothetical protein
MNVVEVCNFLDGKNLCNFFANLIVEELNKIDSNTRTEITVINSRNFFVVRGKTSSENVLNLTDLFSEGLKRINPKWDNPLSVIDTIHYNNNFIDSPLLLNLTFYSDDESDFQRIVNECSSQGLFFNIKIDNYSFVIFYDCKKDDDKKVNNILKENFPQYKIYKSDFSNDIYVSDRYYGLSMNYEKPYHVLLKSISKHVFRMRFSKKLTISIFSEEKYSDIDSLNTTLKIKTDKSVVKKGWLKSLVLDLFPFSENEIMEEYKLRDYNCEYEIIPQDTEVEYPYNKMNKISEFLLV